MKRILVLLPLGMLVLLTYGCGPTSEGSADPEVSISAVDLLKECTTDPKAMNDKYKGHVLSVTGEISLIQHEPDGASIVHLKTGNAFISVICTLAKESEKDVALLRDEQPATVVGRCEGFQAGPAVSVRLDDKRSTESDLSSRIVMSNCRLITPGSR